MTERLWKVSSLDADKVVDAGGKLTKRTPAIARHALAQRAVKLIVSFR